MEISCIAFIATSLDGFIAKADGDVSWLHNPSYDIEGEDFGYESHCSHIDALVMGRNTYELALSVDSWPYSDKPVYVLSSRTPVIPDHLADKVSLMSGNIDSIVARLAENGHRRVYIDGGKTIQGFLSANRLNAITITRIPILLGEGLPLFGGLDEPVSLKHISTVSFTNGFVQSHYSIQRID